MAPPVRIALEIWSADFPQVEATCRSAERLGFDALYYGESPHDLNLDCWTTLAALAQTTDRIRLGPVITNILPTYRSTILLARQAATVAAISENRLDFRTGAGASARFGRDWWEPYGVHYPRYDQRVADLQSALETLPALWAAAAAPSGASGSAEAPTASSRMALAIPITVAATGGRAMRLAAAHAQVWETSFCTPTEFAERDARMKELLGDRNVVRSLEIDGFLSLSDAGLTRLLDRVQSERGSTEDLDAVFDRALLGTPPQARLRLLELADAGVDQVVVALHDPHDTEALHALAHAAAPS